MPPPSAQKSFCTSTINRALCAGSTFSRSVRSMVNFLLACSGVSPYRSCWLEVVTRRQGGAWRAPECGGRRALPEVHAPDAVVADVHDAGAVEVGRVAAVGLPEVRAPDAIVPDVHDAVAVDVAQDAPARGRRRRGGGRPGHGQAGDRGVAGSAVGRGDGA